MAADYFPLVPGAALTYRRRAPGAEEAALRVETLRVRRASGRVEADCRAGGREFLVVADDKEVRAGGEIEFVLPALPGRAWSRPPRDYRIEGLDGSADTPAGLFERCLVVGYETAGGDGGWGRRYYAPGVGLVLETCAGEDDSFELALTEKRP